MAERPLRTAIERLRSIRLIELMGAMTPAETVTLDQLADAVKANDGDRVRQILHARPDLVRTDDRGPKRASGPSLCRVGSLVEATLRGAHM